jgi:hypothetical protein
VVKTVGVVVVGSGRSRAQFWGHYVMMPITHSNEKFNINLEPLGEFWCSDFREH